MTNVDQCIDEMLAELKNTIAAKDLSELLMIGIHTGGVWIAERLHKGLKLQRPLGKLNIAFYRDDFSRIGTHPQVTPSKLPFDVEDKHILLVDDVLHTGRTIRAALNEIFDYGRPASVRLAVLIDRGAHELPIQADFEETIFNSTPKVDLNIFLPSKVLTVPCFLKFLIMPNHSLPSVNVP